MAKKLFIKTYGCQMNVYDSARMAELLAPLGYAPTEESAEADMVILNTCHIRERASEKVFSELGRLRAARRERGAAAKDVIVAVAGCVAQAEGVEIIRRAPDVDIVLGPQTYHRLPELVARATRANGARGPGARRGAGLLDTEFPAESKFDALPERSAPGMAAGVSAFLAVQEGCDKFCTFCVVPYTRGAEFSRPVADILAEAKALVAGGAREITLIGQNVNAYHGTDERGATVGLARLIRTLADELQDLLRIRYTTSHPRDMDDELIDAHGDVPQLMPFLHLPVQSGSDRILEAMNRQHGVGLYRRIADRLREVRPDIALSSDFIVGFPGETERDFDATMRLVAEIGFAMAYSFKYSPRPGTPAAALENRVPDQEQDRRLAALQALLNRQQQDFNRASLGHAVPVLLEKAGRHQGQLVGRTPHQQAVHVEGAGLASGEVIDVRITGLSHFGLRGEIAGAPRVHDRAMEARA